MEQVTSCSLQGRCVYILRALAYGLHGRCTLSPYALDHSGNQNITVHPVLFTNTEINVVCTVICFILSKQHMHI